MENNSQEILPRLNQNDPSLSELILLDTNNYGVTDGEFYSDNSDDYSTLGAAIANNTHLERMEVWLSDGGVADRGFYDGLKQNSSISNLELYCGDQTIAGGVGQEILKVYQDNNSHLTVLSINVANLQSGGDRVIVDTLRCCRNLQSVTLNNCNIDEQLFPIIDAIRGQRLEELSLPHNNIGNGLNNCNVTDAQLLPIVDAVRGHRLLESLRLVDNNIGNAGCEAIAALLIDPNCKLRDLNLGFNAIHNEGATAIANSLTNNKQLQQLYLVGNQIDQSVQDVFSNILCNT